MAGFGTTVLETKNTDAVVVFIFLKHNGLGRVADLNYFYSEKSIPCTNFRVRVTPFACAQFVKAWPEHSFETFGLV